MQGEGKFIGLSQGEKPYVQVDEPHRGVIIMNLSYLEKKFQYELIERANKLFLSIMKVTEESQEKYILSKNV